MTVLGKTFSRRLLLLSLAAAIVVIAAALFPTPAEACCTSTLCPYCVNSSSSCKCGSQMPVCNTFGCNCNTQCGEWTASTDGYCYFSPTCGDSASRLAARKRFDEIDTNHDLKISPDEGWAWVEANGQTGPSLLKELPEKLTSGSDADVYRYEFGQTDADGDGYVSPAEFDSSLGEPGS